MERPPDVQTSVLAPPSGEATDASLIAALVPGGEGASAALRRLHDRYADRMYGVAYRILGDAAEAQDIVQDAWIRACRYAGRFDPEQPAGPWLLRIAGNLARNRRRWRRVRTWVGGEPPPADPAGPADDPGGDLAGRDERERLHAALRRLKSRQRDTLLLHYAEGLGVGEIARTLGIPEGTVKTEMHRGRAKLRTWLAGSAG